jgi:hypothetical protein
LQVKSSEVNTCNSNKVKIMNGFLVHCKEFASYRTLLKNVKYPTSNSRVVLVNQRIHIGRKTIALDVEPEIVHRVANNPLDFFMCENLRVPNVLLHTLKSHEKRTWFILTHVWYKTH